MPYIDQLAPQIDGVDCPSTLGQQVDRLANLVLSAVRQLDEVTRKK
jgi:hypothetical protein